MTVCFKVDFPVLCSFDFPGVLRIQESPRFHLRKDSRGSFIRHSASDATTPEATAHPVPPPNDTSDMSKMMTDVLKQQAAQFEAIVGDLRTQVMQLSMTKQPSHPNNPGFNTIKTQSPSKGSSTKVKLMSTPPTRITQQVPKSGTSSKGLKSPKTPKSNKPPQIHRMPKTPTPTRRRHPLQLLATDVCADFKTVKEVLFVHIKMMWGLYRVNDVPATPDNFLLAKFNQRFSSSKQIEEVINDPASVDLVAQETILSMKEFRAGGGQIARGLGHIDQMSILYIRGILEKVGIRVWGPDLNTPHDSLYNLACRITCLNIFRQLLASGTYNYMNVKLKYTDSISIVMNVYNHYVHYLMAAKYRTELNNVGAIAEQNSRKNIQKNRERLRKERLAFLARHSAKYPPRYATVVAETLAHSDDEYDPIKKVSVIKTLQYRSKNANKFFRMLDVAIQREAEVSKRPTPAHKRVRKLPRLPVPSKFTRAPKYLPLDFYDAAWFNELPPGQKILTADVSRVAFLPDASISFSPKRHPDETIGDARFTAKYLDALKEPYTLEDSEDDNNDDEPESDGNVFIDDSESQMEGMEGSNDPEEESEGEFYEAGDFGKLYEDSDEGSQAFKCGTEGFENDVV